MQKICGVYRCIYNCQLINNNNLRIGTNSWTYKNLFQHSIPISNKTYRTIFNSEFRISLPCAGPSHPRLFGRSPPDLHYAVGTVHGYNRAPGSLMFFSFLCWCVLTFILILTQKVFIVSMLILVEE